MKSKRELSIDLMPDLFGGPARSKYLRVIWTRSRRRAPKSEILFTIEPEDVARLYRDQGGRCEVTNLAFDLERFDTFVKHPFAPSIDRKHSKGGYTPDNVRLVCAAANFGMGQWGQEVYMRLARAAVAHEAQEEGMSEEAWRARQADKITAAQKILSLILEPGERRAQARHIAALKAALCRRVRCATIIS
jgi:hypothetical protein